jgi:hypothetical protein
MWVTRTLGGEGRGIYTCGQWSKVKAGVTNLKTPALTGHMTRFRLRAKIFFLTYSQIGEDVVNELRDTPTKHLQFIEDVNYHTIE